MRLECLREGVSDPWQVPLLLDRPQHHWGAQSSFANSVYPEETPINQTPHDCSIILSQVKQENLWFWGFLGVGPLFQSLNSGSQSLPQFCVSSLLTLVTFSDWRIPRINPRFGGAMLQDIWNDREEREMPNVPVCPRSAKPTSAAVRGGSSWGSAFQAGSNHLHGVGSLAFTEMG